MEWTKIVIIALTLIISGCASPHQINVRNNILADSTVSEFIKTQIINQKISIGMTQEQVIASWGEPCWWCYGTRRSSHGDTWEYNAFGSSVYGAGTGTYLYFDKNGILKYWSK